MVVVAFGLRLKHAQAEDISFSAYSFSPGGTFFPPRLFLGAAGAGQFAVVTVTTTGAAVIVLSRG